MRLESRRDVLSRLCWNLLSTKTMNYTNTQLKQALAKMLPEKLYFKNDNLFWQVEGAHYGTKEVLDTELLTICWEVEEKLKGSKDDEYSELAEYQEQICLVCGNGMEPLNVYEIDCIRASWQQRTIALAAVLRIEI